MENKTMELKDAIQILGDALEAGNKAGAFTLTNAFIVYQAYQIVGQAVAPGQELLPQVEPEAEPVKEEK